MLSFFSFCSLTARSLVSLVSLTITIYDLRCEILWEIGRKINGEVVEVTIFNF